MNYSICIDAVFQNNKNFTDSMRSVRECGFSAFEFWSWWDKDIDAILRVKKELRLEVAALCTRFINPGDVNLQNEFLQGLKETLEIAKRLDCKAIIIQAGYHTKGITYEDHRKSLIEVMKKASVLAELEGITLLLEPLNVLVDHAGYHMSGSLDAFQFCNEIGSPNVKILYDIYHQQITEGNLISNITENIEKIGHFHSAGVPGRGELMSGEINYINVIKAIKNLGYPGYFGLEYMTKASSIQSLRDTKKFIECIE